MNFLGIGPAELIVILVIALIFVGPERLPKLAADLARTIREIRKYTGSLAAEFNEVIQDFEKDTAGEKSAWKEIGEGLTDAAKSVTEAVRDARAEVQSTAAGETASDVTPGAGAPASEIPGGAPEENPEPGWVDISAIPPEAPPATAPTSPNGAAASPPPVARPVEEVR